MTEFHYLILNSLMFSIWESCISSLVLTQEILIGIKNSSECVLNYAKDETSHLCARLIKTACYKHYQRNKDKYKAAQAISLNACRSRFSIKVFAMAKVERLCLLVQRMDTQGARMPKCRVERNSTKERANPYLLMI